MCGSGSFSMIMNMQGHRPQHEQMRERVADNAKTLLQELRGSLHARECLHQLRATLKWQDILDLYDQKVELIDRQPSRGKENALPVLMVPGFSGNAEIVRVHAAELAKRGRRTLCVNAPHGIIGCSFCSHPIPLPQFRKAIALIGALEKKGLQQVDAIGYSEASITIAIAAKIRPTLFRNIILMNPAGMIGSDSLPRLVLSFLVDKIHEAWTESIMAFRKHRGLRDKMQGTLKILREKTTCILSDPLQSARELIAISQVQIHGWLRELQEQHSIRVAIAQSAGDRVFPRKKMDTFLHAAHIQEHRIFYDLQGTHDTVLTHPEHAMEVANRALSALESE